MTGLADLRGQKIWVPEGDETSYVAMQALHLTPVILPITDVLTGLQTGLLDIVATPPVGAVVLQWYTKTKYVTTQPLSYTMGLLVIDQRALGAVTAADQEVLREVLSAVYARFDAQNRIDNTKAEAGAEGQWPDFCCSRTWRKFPSGVPQFPRAIDEHGCQGRLFGRLAGGGQPASAGLSARAGLPKRSRNVSP